MSQVSGGSLTLFASGDGPIDYDQLQVCFGRFGNPLAAFTITTFFRLGNPLAACVARPFSPPFCRFRNPLAACVARRFFLACIKACDAMLTFSCQVTPCLSRQVLISCGISTGAMVRPVAVPHATISQSKFPRGVYPARHMRHCRLERSHAGHDLSRSLFRMIEVYSSSQENQFLHFVMLVMRFV